MDLVGDLFHTNYEQNFHISSITTGIVKENYNSEFPGMVKVELILGEDGKKTTEWVRVAVPYCGKDYGEYFLPEVNTEVVVAFNMGDINCPIVIGCLWNNKDTIPPNTANKDNNIKRIKTKGGHELIFDDNKGNENILLQTKGNLKLKLEDKEQIIKITDKKEKNSIIMDCKKGTITFKSAKKMEFNVGGNNILTLDGSSKSAVIKTSNVKLEANSSVVIKGAQSTKIQGATMEIKAQASLKQEASGMVTLKGAMVKIN